MSRFAARVRVSMASPAAHRHADRGSHCTHMGRRGSCPSALIVLRADKGLVALKEVLKEAGLPQRRLHDLRHTYAADLYAADVHPRSVQEVLGHARLDFNDKPYT